MARDQATMGLKTLILALFSASEEAPSSSSSSSPKEIWNYILVKLKDLLHALEGFVTYLVAKIDEIFPPAARDEKIRRWVAAAAPFVVAGVALFLCLWCCNKCCCRGRRRGAGRWMKAPGRDGVRMPRDLFEANPKFYFRDLRAGRPIEEIF